MTTLASGTASPIGIALDASRVYWGTGDGAVLATPLGGGETTTLTTSLGGQEGGPNRLALHGTTLYWTSPTSPGAIYSCATTGCAKPTTIASGNVAPYGIAADASTEVQS
ncbi:MAG TPA: hypothetical protein VF765_07170 [Polyangiaceae bacterium]